MSRYKTLEIIRTVKIVRQVLIVLNLKYKLVNYPEKEPRTLGPRLELQSLWLQGQEGDLIGGTTPYVQFVRPVLEGPTLETHMDNVLSLQRIASLDIETYDGEVEREEIRSLINQGSSIGKAAEALPTDTKEELEEMVRELTVNMLEESNKRRSEWELEKRRLYPYAISVSVMDREDGEKIVTRVFYLSDYYPAQWNK